MKQFDKFYINGEWVTPVESRILDVINPATELITNLPGWSMGAGFDCFSLPMESSQRLNQRSDLGQAF